MPKKPSKPRPPADENVAAHRVLSQIIAKADPDAPQREKNPAAVALGRLGGLKGGRRSLETMTPADREARAKKAAAARWGKRKG